MNPELHYKGNLTDIGSCDVQTTNYESYRAEIQGSDYPTRRKCSHGMEIERES